MYVHVCMYVHMYVCMCMCVCMYTCMHICACVYARTHVCIYVHVCMYVQEYRKNNVPCWRWVTLRMLATYDITLFDSCTKDKKWLEGVVEEKDKQDAKAGA